MISVACRVAESPAYLEGDDHSKSGAACHPNCTRPKRSRLEAEGKTHGKHQKERSSDSAAGYPVAAVWKMKRYRSSYILPDAPPPKCSFAYCSHA